MQGHAHLCTDHCFQNRLARAAGRQTPYALDVPRIAPACEKDSPSFDGTARP